MAAPGWDRSFGSIGNWREYSGPFKSYAFAFWPFGVLYSRTYQSGNVYFNNINFFQIQIVRIALDLRGVHVLPSDAQTDGRRQVGAAPELHEYGSAIGVDRRHAGAAGKRYRRAERGNVV